ncbi:MAG: COX15/CtaA family protein [Chitinophagales bacterium]
MDKRVRTIIGTWLAIGCVMVFFQVIIGGVTRLTGSGLSITKWDIVTGVIPPLNHEKWEAAFEQYKNTPQYQQINQDMQLNEFQFIYFWEYFHRLWARTMGLVFLIPFLYFYSKKWLPRDLLFKLGIVVLWGGLIGLLGWIMVASGLDKRPYVAPIKLTIHLTPAMCLLGYLGYLTLYVFFGTKKKVAAPPSTLKMIKAVLLFLIVQLFLGGIVSGMKAGLAFPTWPTMNGEWVPDVLFHGEKTLDGITQFSFQATWGQALIQLLHRSVAYLLIAAIFFFFYKNYRLQGDAMWNWSLKLYPVTVCLQALIGIITVTNCIGHIPVFYGVLHQAGAMLLLMHTILLWFQLPSKNMESA